MSDSRFSEFCETFRQRVREAASGEPEADGVVPVTPRETAITEVLAGDLLDQGQIGDLELIYFEKRIGRKKGKLNGYAIRDEDAQVDLVVTLPARSGDSGLATVGKTEVETAASQALHVFLSASRALHAEMEPSSEARDMIEQLDSIRPDARRIRVLVFTDGRFGRAPKLGQVDGLPPTHLELWDLERLYRATSSGQTYESVQIDLEHLLGHPVPCLEAPQTSEDHHCYLAILPGGLLHDLYHDFGPRLLELNVRSFLQARGKVNRGIRDTLMQDPLHFFPYNNGLSATVEDVELVRVEGQGLAIRSVTGLQIVNGGQTVASIHRAKDRDKADLSGVYVQAKITKVVPGSLETLVPNISRYSNTQNSVNETDFSANHPFHVKVQQLSETVWAPGEVSRWFYERARGQWEVARSRTGTTPARLRKFDQEIPKKQKLDKILLARTVNAWSELPHIVSRGGQKNFVHFMKELQKNGESWEPDEAYYRRLVARVIVYKKAEQIARRIKFSGYSANAVCYTIAMLAYRTAGRVNLDDVWLQQGVSEALVDTMQQWMPEIHFEIVESAGERNVTEWCKRIDCWTHMQSLQLDLPRCFEEELAEGLPLPNVGKYREAKGKAPRSLTPEERERQAITMRYTSAQWAEILEWASKSGEATPFEMNIIGTIIGYAAGGWRQVPSPKQTKYTAGIVERWLASRGAEGFASVDA
jgi:hypothetical protein